MQRQPFEHNKQTPGAATHTVQFVTALPPFCDSFVTHFVTALSSSLQVHMPDCAGVGKYGDPAHDSLWEFYLNGGKGSQVPIHVCACKPMLIIMTLLQHIHPQAMVGTIVLSCCCPITYKLHNLFATPLYECKPKIDLTNTFSLLVKAHQNQKVVEATLVSFLVRVK